MNLSDKKLKLPTLKLEMTKSHQIGEQLLPDYLY
jgi:hypothetical protein